MEKQRSPPLLWARLSSLIIHLQTVKTISVGIQSFCSALPRQDLEVSLSALPLWDIACVIDLVKQSGSFIKKQYSFVNVPTVFCFLFAPAQQHVPPGLCRFYILCLVLCFCFLFSFCVFDVKFCLFGSVWSTELDQPCLCCRQVRLHWLSALNNNWKLSLPDNLWKLFYEVAESF